VLKNKRAIIGNRLVNFKFGVWCLVFGVWCLVFGVEKGFSFLVKV
jgi:hypothetical protein